MNKKFTFHLGLLCRVVLVKATLIWVSEKKLLIGDLEILFLFYLPNHMIYLAVD